MLAGVAGPRSLHLSGSHADGTILPEGHGPDEIATARRRIDEGRRAAGRTDQHHLTVFAAFFVGSGSPPGLPADASDAWLAVGSGVDEVTAKLATALDAGVDSLVLVPMGDAPMSQLDLATARIVPGLRDHAAGR